MGSVEQGVTPAAEHGPALASAGHGAPDASAPSVLPLDRASSVRFEDRYEELAAIAYRVTFRLLGSRQDAEDLTQETLTRAYQRWRRVRGHAEPWVARVSANLALDAIRRGKRRPTTSTESTGGADERPAAERGSVVDRLDLVRSLQCLPNRQREVVVLRYLADLPEAAVAEELGISLGSVKQHASRGLAALRETADPSATKREDSDVRAP